MNEVVRLYKPVIDSGAVDQWTYVGQFTFGVLVASDHSSDGSVSLLIDATSMATGWCNTSMIKRT